MSHIITNGQAWSLIPYAWYQLKPSTVRNCFAKTHVLSAQKSEQWRRRRKPAEEQLKHIRYQHHDILLQGMRAYFENLIVEKMEYNNEQWHWKLRQDGMMDAHDIEDEALSARPAVEDVDETAKFVSTLFKLGLIRTIGERWIGERSGGQQIGKGPCAGYGQGAINDGASIFGQPVALSSEQQPLPLPQHHYNTTVVTSDDSDSN
ncbi:hypothetical protein BGX30_001072 [Mortierella sp. GBA39]|nr:hypothetical protein BGX30_001072 [Mortierella sp. GBA39]